MCSNCGVNMGEYFCVVCRFYDDDVNLMIYELSDCFRFDRFLMPIVFVFSGCQRALPLRGLRYLQVSLTSVF